MHCIVQRYLCAITLKLDELAAYSVARYTIVVVTFTAVRIFHIHATELLIEYICMELVTASKDKFTRRTAANSYCVESKLITYFMVADVGLGDARSNAICPIVVIALTSVVNRVEMRPFLRTRLGFSMAPNHLQKQHKNIVGYHFHVHSVDNLLLKWKK